MTVEESIVQAQTGILLILRAGVYPDSDEHAGGECHGGSHMRVTMGQAPLSNASTVSLLYAQIHYSVRHGTMTCAIKVVFRRSMGRFVISWWQLSCGQVCLAWRCRKPPKSTSRPQKRGCCEC